MTKNSNAAPQKIITLLILLTLLPSCSATRWDNYFGGGDELLISRTGDGLVADNENALYDDSIEEADKVQAVEVKKVTKTKFVDNRKTIQQIQKTNNEYISDDLQITAQNIKAPVKPLLSNEIKKAPVKVVKNEDKSKFSFDKKLFSNKKPVVKAEKTNVAKKSKFDLSSYFVANRKKDKQVSEDKESEYTISYKFATFYYPNGGIEFNSKYNKRISEIVDISKKYGGKVRVIGHASSRTKDMDLASHNLVNFVTSVKRAELVAKRLLKAGLNKDNLIIEAFSDREPIYAEIMPAGEDMNRRTEIYIDY